MLISYNILRDNDYQQQLSLSNMPILTPMATNENNTTNHETNGINDDSAATSNASTVMNAAPLVDLLSIGTEAHISCENYSINSDITSSSIVLPMSVSSNTNGTSNSNSSRRATKSITIALSPHDISVITAARNAANELSALSAEIMKVRYPYIYPIHHYVDDRRVQSNHTML
jgi:hypothetical protein